MIKVYYENLNNSGPEPKFDKDFNLEYEYTIPCLDFETEVKYIAEDYFHNHDGWECSWPVTFRFWQEDGTFIGDFEVEMEAEPRFYATKVSN